MKFGVFDYIEKGELPLNRIYDDRIALVKALEAAGFERVDRFVEMKALGIFSEYQALRP